MTTTETAPPPKIVILDRGFVLVGKVKIESDWVETTDTTKLDPVGTVRSPLRALIGLVDCEPSKWAN